MSNIEWKITRIKWDVATGGVTSADWTLSATEGDSSGKVRGVSKFNPDPSSESFIPIDSLTEDTVVSWVHEYVINKDGLEKTVLKRLEEAKNPTETTTGLPWSS